jgi:hypothetical protein
MPLISVEGQPTKAVLAQTCMGVFIIRSVYNIIFAFFSSETVTDHLENRCGTPVVRGPQFEKH